MGWGNKFPDMKNDPTYLEGRVSNNESQLAQKATKTFVIPEDFGAVGDGVTDDSTAFVNMYSYAQTNKTNVKLTKPHYVVKRSLNATGVSTFSEVGSVLDIQLSSATYGNAFSWGGENTGISGVVFWLSNTNTNTPMQGIINSVSNVKNQWFTNNRVIGKTFKSDGVTGNIYGGWYSGTGISGLKINNNYFETVNYPIQVNQQQTGGNIATPLGNPVTNIFIENNIVYQGTIGINTPHVYCNNVFIKNNHVTCNTDLHINIAHVSNFVIDGNTLDGTNSATDSCIHIEDVSYAGQVINNIIRPQNNADGIRLLLVSGVSQDTYVPTEGILIKGNDIKGVGNGCGIKTNDTSTKRIFITENRIENFSTGSIIIGSQCDVINNRFKLCSLCLNISAIARIQGMTIESCTTIVRSTVSIELSGLVFQGEVPTLAPQTAGSNVAIVYKDVKFTSASITMTSNTAFNLFTLPTNKFNFNLIYRSGDPTNCAMGKLNITYDGTTYTPTKTYEILNGTFGGGTFAVTGGVLTESHYVANTSVTGPFFIDIENILFIG